MLPTVQVCRAFFTVPCDGLIQIKGVPCDGLIQIKSRFQPLSFASFVERAWDRGWKIYRGSRNSRSCEAEFYTRGQPKWFYTHSYPLRKYRRNVHRNVVRGRT